MMKLGTVTSYLKKIQKYMNHVTHPLSSAGIGIFSLEFSKFSYINKYRYRLSLKIVLINMVSILMISAKMVTPVSLK